MTFNPTNFDFWAKLQPLSVLYVHEDNKKYALKFLRRFPLFEIYVVPKLHRKAVFFFDSGRLLLGSENLFGREPDYSELMIETTIKQEQKDEIVNMAFRSLEGKILTCKYDFSDIRLHLDFSFR
jgi:hypothetical protein